MPKKISITSFIVVLLLILNLQLFLDSKNKAMADNLKFDEQEATIRAIKSVAPAVVNIVLYDTTKNTSLDLSTGEKKISELQEQKGSGTGFIISADGLILTNKHVINSIQEKTGDFKVILNNGKEYFAQLIGKDPVNDLAVLKIFDKNLPYVKLGDSGNLELGTTVIAIGNALGKYQNTVTKGIVSGLGRYIVASDKNGNTESVVNVIQTDAEINVGNSGGPLINLNGELIGINVAIDQEGSSLGFAIPINDAKQVIKSVTEFGQILRPMIGVNYLMVTPELAKRYKLPRNSGAIIAKNESTGVAITPKSPAEMAGLIENDII
ncbi:MAG: trypsin-like peptidase domain-containing protein, partial [Candidatus Falkowbacteria bacterium]|nr:trypsin-like peptidase domain-containing protein [Candidatus Falkowbacteria bacterium]